MNGILGFASLLKQPQLSGEQQTEYINIIERSGIRMLSIINDIIDISKIESGQVQVYRTLTNIDEQLKDMYEFFKPEAEKKNLSLKLKSSIPPTKVMVFTDKEKLYAILTNLIKNAIKITETGVL
jgi:signal transduction histidine kinase